MASGVLADLCHTLGLKKTPYGFQRLEAFLPNESKMKKAGMLILSLRVLSAQHPEWFQSS
jgi:hypothetical protein